jgi:hypothetical protein
MKLYHFRDEKYGLMSIRDRRLKIARIMELNDPFEFLGINLKDRNLRRAMNSAKQKLSGDMGLICFSSNWDNPVQWSHYADHHRGLCLEFEVNKNIVEKVTYSNHRIQVHNEVDLKLMRQILSTKFSHWTYEQEYRAFVKLDHNDQERGLYFKAFDEDLKLTSVIVGHSSTITRKDVSDTLGDIGDKVTSFKARAAFTKFKVVRNNNESLWT